MAKNKASKTIKKVLSKEEKAVAKKEALEIKKREDADKKKSEARAKANEEKAKAKIKKGPKLVDHELSQDDLDANPELAEKGLKIGDVIQVPEESSGAYHLSVKMNDETFEVDTDDVAGTLLELNPQVFKTKVVIDVQYEDRTAQFVLMIAKAKRIFRNDLAAIFFEKNLKLSLNGK